jgi:glycosyltransferase involved in cell wall biosynthesis
MRKPAVSIAISFYNPGPFFIAALKSVFAQTFADWELLLLDDGSTDGSVEVVSRLKDDRVRVFVDGVNRGLSYRLNQSAQLASGEYLFRMDADDIMHPERLCQQLAVLQSSSKQTVVGTACYTIDQNSQIVGWRPVTATQYTGYEARHSFVHPTVAAATTWFKSNEYSQDYRYRRAEDAELWCRASSHSEFKWVTRPLLFYRESGVFSISNYLAGQEALLDLIRRLEPGRAHRWLLSSKERFKMAFFRGLSVLHCNDLIVRHRYSRLSPEELAEPQRIIGQVFQTSLPL